MMLGQPDLKKRFSLTACDISMGIEALSRVVLSSSAGAGGKPPKLLIMSPVQVGEIAGSPMGKLVSCGGNERTECTASGAL